MRSKRSARGDSGRPPKSDGSGRGATGSGEGNVPAGPRDNPIDFLLGTHAAQLQLCDQLEAIADSLPGNVDRAACHRAAMTLRSDVYMHHMDEERGLFPLLSKHATADTMLNDSIRRLEAEHASDEGFSDELMELLERLARGEKPHDKEAAGYMLRGFFESFRRHLAFETEVILPRARALLTEADCEALLEVLNRNRREAPRLLYPKEIDGKSTN